MERIPSISLLTKRAVALAQLFILIFFISCENSTRKEEVTITIDSVSPSFGGVEGGTLLSIRGSVLQFVNSVTIDGEACTNLTVSDDEVTCETPEHAAGAATIRLFSSKDGAVTTSFTYVYPPLEVDAITPTLTRTTGGTRLVVTGVGFSDGMIVSIGGVNCPSVFIADSETLSCVIPVLPAGVHSVVIQDAEGESVTAVRKLTAAPAPVMTSITPDIGSSNGGTIVTITGTDFDRATVLVGGLTCAISSRSSTSITCVTAAKNAAPTYVRITNASNISATYPDAFTYVQAPVPMGISPALGVPGGGDVVTVTGTNFGNPALVTIGGIPCTPVTFVSSTQLTCTTGAQVVGTYDVVVENPDTFTGTLNDAFEYRELPPTLTSVAPPEGVIGGGQTITLTGSGFRAGVVVTINGLTCTTPNILSPTSMECDTPASLTEGAKDIVVTNTDGQTATLVGGFTYMGPPTVASVSPQGGTVNGGNTITVTGTNFRAGLAVTVGGLICDNIVINSLTELTCEPRAHAPGAEDIVITNVDSQSGTGTGIYLYANVPTITSTSPNGGPAGGGFVVSIIGTDFQSGATVKLDTDDCTPVTFVSSTQLDCVTPAHALGAVAVEVTNPDSQVGTLAGAYTYQLPPTLTNVSPAGGTTAGGTSIVLTGTDFMPGVSVKIGTATCTVTAESAVSITCTTPAHAAGANTVTVTNPDNQSAALTNGFTYLAPPTVTSASPDSGALLGGTTVTLTGTGFFNGATVDFDGSSCGTVLVTSPTTLTCVTTAHAAGPVNVTVENIDGQSGTGSVYTYSPAPVISAVTPTAGALAGGTSITIDGTDFVTGATVDFGGSPCTVTSTAATQILCTTTAHASGAVDVTVTNPDNQLNTSSGGYTYQPAPTVTAASPGGISASGGNTLTLTGTGFVAGADVLVGGVACTVSALTSTSIDCLTGVHAAGVVDIVVTNDDGQSATLGSSVTYLDPPTLISVSPSSGRLAGGGVVTLTGTNFFSGAIVEINGISCPVVTRTGTQITCTIPADVAGAHDVVVTNVDDQAVTLAGGYTHQPAPTVSAVAFNAGAIAGGTTVTVQGSDFLTGAVISFGGINCPVTGTPTSTAIDCITPAHAAGTVNVLVTNPDAQIGTLLSGFTYQAAPVITSVSPVVGSVGGGTTVTITGTGFRPSPSVLMGTFNCAVVSSTSTSITCTTTAAVSAGTVDVRVTNQDSQFNIKTNSFTYLDAPAVASVTPAKGRLSGGSTVTITGSNFYTGAKVYFGTKLCTVTSLTSTSITCVTPSNVAGLVDVTVENVDLQTGGITNSYEYRPAPSILTVSPTFGPVGGNTSITITGTNFVAGATVLVGSSACAVTSETVPTSITCLTSLSMVSGSATVRVTNPVDLQTGAKTNSFIYLMPPTIASVSPSAGTVDGGTTITISGSGFYPGATATVGGLDCTSPVVVSDTMFTCVTDAHVAGSVPVVLTNGDGQQVTRATGFTYQEAPTVTMIAPGSGPLAGNSLVTINGTNFASGASVRIDGNICTSVVFVNATTITCRTPPGLDGPADVTVTNADGQTDTSPGLYEYQAGPTLTSVSPAGGPLAGGTTIKLIGTFFRTGVSVKIGGIACTPVTEISATEIDCVTPANAGGSYTVVVSNFDGQTASKVNGFRYQGAPTVTNISPAVGASAGNTLVTVSGTNFLSAASVSIGGTACTSVVVAGPTSLSCRTGVHAAGTGTISVTNSDGQSGTGSSYLYQDAPTVASVLPATSPVAGNQAITITGTGFVTGATVKIGGVNCTSVVVVSLTEITCVTGAKTGGTYDLVVMNSDTQTGTLTAGFVYQGSPVVSVVSPARGDVNGGQVLTITGSSFITGATVSVSGTACAVSAVSSTSITCTTGAKVAGLYNVVVTNPDSQTGTRANSFTYVNAPTVTSVSPATGTTVGGTTITITGTDFYSGSAVDLGGVACTSVNVTSTTSLTCRTPANAAGAVAVSVISPFSTTGTLAGGFTYVSAPPTLAFVTGTSSPTPPNPDSYGTTAVNVTHTFTITNNGGSDTTAVTVTIGGANPAAWDIGTDTCSGAVLSSAETCTVQVIFLGAFLGSGNYTGTVTATAATGGTASNVITGRKP